MAGEYAVLTSGARLYAERHEVDGSKVRLYTKTGFTEMDRALVTSFEAADQAAPTEQSPNSPTTKATQGPPPNLDELVENAARKYQLPPAFVRAVIAAESAYRPDAVSPKGAIGLMQLMPSTAKDLGADPTNPAENVDAGTRYLRNLLLKYDNRMYHALAAYNAGPGAVDKYHGIPPYQETYAYIRTVLRNLQKTQSND
jgi:soluble lytic murein transglycosylase-like protein